MTYVRYRVRGLGEWRDLTRKQQQGNRKGKEKEEVVRKEY